MNKSPEMSHELVNDVPVIMRTITSVLGLADLLDDGVPRHGNRAGLSIGKTMAGWLTHILSECNHFMSPVQDWANHLTHTLSSLLGQAIQPTDFTDDRLAEVAYTLSFDEVWHGLERSVTRRAIRVYELPMERVRLDTTTGKVYGGDETSVLFQRGHSKDHRPDLRQFKVMLAALDPLGLLVGADVVAGQTADDTLYVPMMRRMRETLKPAGLLFVGDCKMGALSTRAYVQATGNTYLMPLAQVGRVPADLAGWVERALSKQVQLKRWRDDEHRVAAEGYEVTRSITGQPPESTDWPEVTWTERVLIVRSRSFAQAARRGLRERLDHARADLLALTPPPGRGRHSFTEEAPLQAAAQAILERHDVVGLLTFSLERHEERRAVRAYGNRPARTEARVHYTLTVQRQTQAIRDYERTLGWRVYVTNATPEQLSFEQAVQAYRDEWLIERDCARLKGRILSLAPLWVSREDHAIGLTRLLTLAARVLALVEYDVRRKLKAKGQSLAGLYPGQPTRVTDQPTTERLLKAFDRIALVVIRSGRQVQRLLTPLNDLQRAILDLLGYPIDLYERLVDDSAY
jgi:transposase